MATQVQFRRGTTTQNNAFTGAAGEISVDTDLKTIRLHDGVTAGGGSAMLNTVSSQTALNKTFSTGSVWQGTAVGLGYGGTGSALTAAAGAVAYSTASGLGLTAAGTSGQVLVSGGVNSPTWVAASSIAAGTATLATTATNIAGGSAGQLIIQADTGLSTFITAGASGTFLRSAGAGYAPTWATADVTLGTTVVSLGSGTTSLDGLNILTATGTSHWRLPVGTTAQRPATPLVGMVRYNSSQTTFEGYSSGAWSSLGGVKSVDALTYIQAETSAGASNGDLDFFAEDSAGTAATQVGQWNRTNLKDYTGTIVGTQTTQNVFNATATTVNAFGAATALTIGATTGTATLRNTTVAITNNATVGGTLAVTGNSTLTGDLAVNGGDVTTTSTTGTLFNTGATTLNIGGAATTVSIGAATGTLTLNNANTVITGNLTVNGTTTTINSTVTSVDDIEFELGAVATPTDITANGGGIRLKGATDKTINWSSIGWTSSEDFNLVTGKQYEINGTSVLSATTLGSGVTGSSLTSVGTIGTGVWQGTIVAPTYGGTGVNNGSNTLTMAGSVTHAGAFARTFTATAATSLTLPTTGTLATLAGVETLTNKTINLASNTFTATSAQMIAAVADETGSGVLVFNTSPTLVTPVLGVASATSINKVEITAPATGSTLTIADGKTLTASNTLTLTGTDASSVAFGAGGTVAYVANKLSAFAATTSAELAGVISDETGSGSLVFASSPSLITPTINGGGANFSGSTSGSLNIKATAVAGTGVIVTIPATTGTLVTTGDTGTVTSTMIADGTIVNGDISASAAIAVSKISGLATSATTDTTNAGNISAGTLPAARLPAFTGDATSTAGTSALALAASGVTAGTYTTATITVDAKGRVTSASSGAAVSGSSANTANTLVQRDASGNSYHGTLFAGAFQISSDERLKTNIQESSYGLKEILALNSVQYDKDNRHEIGLIAQQVETLMPEFVVDGADGYKSLNYTQMVSVLVQAVQDLKSEVDALKAQLGK